MVALETKIHRYVQNTSRRHGIHDCRWTGHGERRKRRESIKVDRLVRVFRAC